MRWRSTFLVVQEREARWTQWFAWFPVRVGLNWVWLETVERRRDNWYCSWEYRDDRNSSNSNDL